MSDRYLLANAQTEAGERFTALSEIFDDNTRRHVLGLGIAPGWRVWEVGAGGASVPAWLSSQVGSTGAVLATDIDTSWITGDQQFEVLRHDVTRDDPPAGPFDLIHARLVLVHLTDRDAVLHTLVSALRPGGWLLIEDADPGLQPLVCPDEYGPEQRLANKLKGDFRTLLRARGADTSYGRTLPRRLRAAGLADVVAVGYFPLTSPACQVLERATTQQLRGQLVESGLASGEEIDAHLRNVASGALDLCVSPMISAWGRRKS